MGNAVCDYYANIKAKPVEWLWYPYIPFGKITVIQGDPGEGKSTVALDLVSRLTRGLPMPDGYPVSKASVAIYQCAEALFKPVQTAKRSPISLTTILF